MNNIVENYNKLLTNLKEKILHSQQKAIYAVNKELVLLYWEIGIILYLRTKLNMVGVQRLLIRYLMILKNIFQK